MSARIRMSDRTVHRFFLGGLAVAAVLLALPPALAQEEGGGPLDFIRPWLEREILGRGSAKPEEPPTGSVPTGQDSDAGNDDAGPSLRGENGGEGPVPAPDAGVNEPAPEGESVMPEAGDPAASGSAREEGRAVPADEPPAIPIDPGPEPLRFAVLAGRTPLATLAAVAPVATDLGDILGRPVELLPLPTYAAMIDAQIDRRIDGGFYSALAFALAETRCSCLEPLVAPRASDGTLGYHAIIVARAGSGIDDASDLAGRSVAVAAEDSIGGRRMQFAGLAAEGIEPSALGHVLSVASPEAGVRLVALGEVDAAFAWSSLKGAVETGYTRGTLASLVSRGEAAMSDLTIVWRSPPIEHGPFALLESTSDEDKAKVAAYLLGLGESRPEAYDALDPLYGGGYAPVTSRDYAGMGMLAEHDAGEERAASESGADGE
jgi:phosphonate transport system substrate-binding protein